MNFYKLLKLSSAGKINTIVNWGRGQIPYVALDMIGIDPEIRKQIFEDLKGKDYRLFGNYGKQKLTKRVTPENIDQIKSEIDSFSSLGLLIDHSSGLDKIKKFFDENLNKPEIENPTEVKPEITEKNKDNAEEKKEEEKPNSLEPEKIKELREKFKGAIWTKNPFEKGKAMADVVAEAMRTLATNASDVLKSGNISDYLFVQALNKRSWYNQILAMIQRPDANMLKGAVQWLNHGRFVPGYPYKREDLERLAKLGINIPSAALVKEDKSKNAIVQCLPKRIETAGMAPYDSNTIIQSILTSMRQNGNLTWQGQGSNFNIFIKNLESILSTFKFSRKYISFVRKAITDHNLSSSKDVLSFVQSSSGKKGTINIFEYKPIIYDISDTEHLPEYESKTGKKPVEPIKREDWIGRNLGDPEKASIVIEALKDFATSKNIPVSYKKTGEAGGWADKDGVVVDIKANYVTILGTLVHEITHKLLHFEGEKLEKIRKDIDGADRETDAESSAYILKTKLGYEAENAPVYIAIHNSRKFSEMNDMEQHIKARAKVIDKVVGEITEFIDNYFQNTGNERFIEASSKNRIIKIFNLVGKFS